MAIALDAQGAARSSTGSTVTISSFVVGAGSDKMLIALTTVQDSNHSNFPVTGVTWDSTAMTNVREDEATGNTGSGIWYLVAPASTTGDVVATSTGDTGEHTVGVFSLTGVAQVAPEADNGATGSSASVDVDLTTVADDTWTFTVTCHERTYASIDDTQTAHTSYPLTDQEFENAHCGRKAHTSAGAKSLDYTANGSATFSISAVSVAEAAAGGTVLQDLIGEGIVPFPR